jgi:CheY-like chemotaxis protein
VYSARADEALAALDASGQKPQVLVSDIRMPGESADLVPAARK